MLPLSTSNMSVPSMGYCASGLLGGRGNGVCSICVNWGPLSLISLKSPFELISGEKSSEKNVKSFCSIHYTDALD